MVKPAEELRGLISYGRGTEQFLCCADHWTGHFGAIPWDESSSNTLLISWEESFTLGRRIAFKGFGETQRT